MSISNCNSNCLNKNAILIADQCENPTGYQTDHQNIAEYIIPVPAQPTVVTQSPLMEDSVDNENINGPKQNIYTQNYIPYNEFIDIETTND